MEVVEFVTEIEGEFSVQFSDRDLQDPRFVTIGGLAEVIRELSAQASESIR
jgi:acyl carrier protein